MAIGEEAQPSAGALLRHPDFGPYITTSTLSNVGTWFQDIAAAILVYDLTGSATWVGAVTLCGFAAVFLLAPVAGSLADRVDRRRLLIASQWFQAIPASVLVVMTAVGLSSPWPVLAVALVSGVGKALAAPAMQAFIPGIVTRAELPSAVALQAVSFNLSRAVGPVAGALVVATSGVTAAFAVNVFSFVPFLVVLIRIRVRAPEDGRMLGHDRRLRVALQYVRTHRGMAYLLAAIAVLGGALEPVNTLAPPYAERFAAGKAGVGLLVSAFGVGTILMAVQVPLLRRLLPSGRAGTLGVVLQAAGLTGLAFASSLLPALVALLIAGGGYLLAQTDVTTQLQEAVPDHLRGRVMALWSLGFLGSRPLAAVAVGWIADQTSVRVATTAAAVVAMAAALLPSRAAAHIAVGTGDQVTTL